MVPIESDNVFKVSSLGSQANPFCSELFWESQRKREKIQNNIRQASDSQIWIDRPMENGESNSVSHKSQLR